MKFLLTSSGLTNKSITDALFDLVGKAPGDTRIAFIPTAANADGNDKSWFINDLVNIQKQNFKLIDIVDISALEKKNWLPRLEAADVIMVSGGNTFHLMYWLKRSGLADLLPELLKTRVYVGVSAGSIVMAKDLSLTNAKKLYYDEIDGEYEGGSLGYFNFHVRPHFNSPHFPNVRKEFLEEKAKEIPEPIYALDDNSAMKIVGDKIEIVSEGDYLILNK